MVHWARPSEHAEQHGYAPQVSCAKPGRGRKPAQVRQCKTNAADSSAKKRRRAPHLILLAVNVAENLDPLPIFCSTRQHGPLTHGALTFSHRCEGAFLPCRLKHQQQPPKPRPFAAWTVPTHQAQPPTHRRHHPARLLCVHMQTIHPTMHLNSRCLHPPTHPPSGSMEIMEMRFSMRATTSSWCRFRNMPELQGTACVYVVVRGSLYVLFLSVRAAPCLSVQAERHAHMQARLHCWLGQLKLAAVPQP